MAYLPMRANLLRFLVIKQDFLERKRLTRLRQIPIRKKAPDLFGSSNLTDEFRSDKRVSHLTSLFFSDLSRPWTNEEMAQSVNLSVPHLNRLFKIQTGMPPARFLRELRLELAARLLRETFLSVKEIRFKTGFYDKSKFIKEFKKKYGAPPLDYRKQNRTGAENVQK